VQHLRILACIIVKYSCGCSAARMADLSAFGDGGMVGFGITNLK